ncbi:phosphotransferase [Streptomyces sp. Je 1-79]|uniref:phosphotransferase n=1 Tax=Streptomyces sp. Je 1-79 TaxID=2943847 RepID=UPI0021A28D77|nr:phosphotransferase [Streptomyces sp. Je 1-79]MCT4356551.1 phosphotransferase [Streptomyces sp. Je 1-79]
MLIGTGRTADVFALDGGWVVRRYRNGVDTAHEAATMTHLAAHGYPVPRVRSASGPDLVMRRLTGPSLLDALLAEEVTPQAGAAILADLLHRLHAIPSPAAAPLLHLDLHPGNVVLTAEGPFVIDWLTAEPGAPGLDWAMSALILAEVAVAPVPYAENARVGMTSLLTHAPAGPLPLAAAHHRRSADPHLDAAELARLDGAAALVAEAARVSPGPG